MSASARTTPIRQLSRLADVSFEEGSVVGFNGAQAGVEQVALWDDDHVEPGGDFVATKDLSNQSLRSISLNGSAELAGRCNPQPADPALVGQDEHRAVAAMESDAPFVYLLVFGAAADSFVWAEAHQRAPGPLLAAYGQALPPLGAAPLQHETPVFCAHSHEKPMRPFTMTRVGLKSTDPFGHDIPSTRNEPSMLTSAFEECQSALSVLQSASFLGRSGRSEFMHFWSVAKVFHTC